MCNLSIKIGIKITNKRNVKVHTKNMSPKNHQIAKKEKD